MELTGYLAVARRWWWTLLVAMWVAAVAGFLVASRITPTYEAQVQLLVGPINTDRDTLTASGLLVQTYAQLAISPPLLKSTAQEAGGLDPVKLGQNVRATANGVTRVLAIRVQDSDPVLASSVANKMADELIQLTTGATTRPEGQLEVIGAAVPPTSPIAPQVSLIVLLAMAAGLIGGLVLVIVVEYATDTVRDRIDLARLSGTDVIATISVDPRIPAVSPLPVAEATAPGSPSAVALRLLASKVAFAEGDLPTRTIMVGGVSDGDTAIVALGIAAAVAGSGHRAVVIDGSPDGDITASLEMSGRRGLREVLGHDSLDPRDLLVAGPAGVMVLPRGEVGGAELIAVDRAQDILDGLLRVVDLVVIDGGTMQRSAGALTWARAAQESILLVRRGASRREDLRLAMESLRFVNAAVGGTVLVQRLPGRGFRRRDRIARWAAAPIAPSVARRLDDVSSEATAPFTWRVGSPMATPVLDRPGPSEQDSPDSPVLAGEPSGYVVPAAVSPTVIRTTTRTRSSAKSSDPAAPASDTKRRSAAPADRTVDADRPIRRSARTDRTD